MATESILSIINPHPTWQSGPKLLHQLISQTGSRKALEHTKDRQQISYTYDDLQAVSDKIAAHILRITGSHEGQLVVPVLIEQSPILYASLLGILKAGGAFCPLNIDAPPERVAFILKDVNAPVILVSSDLISRVPDEADIKSVVVEWHSFVSTEDFTLNPRSLSHEDFAYVMYTSGSTGTPKGVGISHLAVTQALLAHDRHIPSFARFLQFAAPTFDVSVFEIFFPLWRGSTLVSARRRDLLEDLSGVINYMNIDACELTPTVAGGLLKSRTSVPKLKLLLTIGEMLTEPVVREFGGSDQKESILWAMYGPTEATIHCTLQTAMDTSSSVKNIGVPLETVSCFIVRAPETDERFEFEVLPIGAVGELAVGGYQLANGYLNRPEQSGASFISTPYGRLYRTGDKARMLSNGTIECLGRLSDGQVKLRGQRMELGEVQEAILRTPGCRNAVAVIYDSNLIAFCAADADVLEDAIVLQCKRWLPSFMVPSEIVLMDSLPRLPSGKLDKKRLVADFKQQRDDVLRDDPTNLQGLPQELLEIVSKVLDCKAHPSAPLSSLGLDSLKSIQLSSTLRASGFETDPSSILRTRTLTDLWMMVKDSPDRPQHSPSDLSLLANLDDLITQAPSMQASRDDIEDITPCTPLQSAMLSESTQSSSRYWNEVEMATTHNNLERVGQALSRLIEDNEILRTGFVSTRKGFVAVLMKKRKVDPSVWLVDHFRPKPRDLLAPFDVQAKYSSDHSCLRLLFTLHHAIYDGWSLDLILDDLLSVLQGHSIQARPQFRQVLNHHQPSPQNEKQKLSAQAYWAEHLLGWTKDPFPSLRGESLQSDPQPGTTTATLSLPFEEVSRASRDLDCSVQTLFQASLALVWSGITASEDFVIGSVTSGRTIPVAGIESLLGPCIASLPLRIDLTKTADIRQLVNHIHASNRAMMEHCALPLPEICKLTELRAGQTLYDVMFAYQQSPKSSIRRGAELWEVQHIDRLETKVLVEVEPTSSGFLIQATYHRDVLASSMIDSFIRQMDTALTSLLADTASSLTSVQRRLEVDTSIFNPHPTRFDGIPDLAAMFEEAAKRSPQNHAVCFAEPGFGRSLKLSSITYRRLNSLANKIGHFLLSERLGTRQVIGMVMDKSILMYATILGILKIGCAYLPILPSTPPERIRRIFSQAKTRYCLVDRESASALSSFRRGPRLLDIESAPLADFNDHNLDIAPDGSRLAYVIYTSGTTGEPKGVAVTQLSIASNIGHLRDTYPQSKNRPSRLLQACSQAFDVSVFEIFYAWHAGMCLCSGTNDTIFEDLEHAIRELGVTHLSLTPTVASLINPEKTPDVELLVTAGEPLTHSVLEAWGDRLWQGYGPSETTNICSVKRMMRGMPIEHLGFVFPNTSVFVAHLSTLNPVPFGWVGEFCYGGDQIAQGYLNMPNLTSERFVDHPKFGRVYRSGDMGRMLPDGSLIILGRVDDQLKLRGQRIEAGEINNTVLATGAAKSSVTIIAERPGASKQLVSFYVPPADVTGSGILDIDPSTTQLLFSALQSKLPSYMVPSYLVPLACIPLTSSGKLHRRHLVDLFRNLPSHYLEEATSAQEGDDARGDDWTELEMSIANSMSEHLSIDVSDIKRWTPFTSLGVDSISAIGLTQTLAECLDRRIPVSVLVRSPNVSQLAHTLEQDAPVASRHNSLEVFQSSFIKDVLGRFSSFSQTVEAVLPCTPLQEAMLSAGSGSYYNKTLLRLNTQVDRMKSCWQEMIKRHQILRTCFVATPDPDRPVAQVVLQDWDMAWIHLVATKPSFNDVIREHTSHLTEPLESKTPPMSFATIQYRGSVFLSLIFHHALYDGVAMDVLWREVEALANGSSLPAPVPYEPFLREMITLPQDVEKFWKSQLYGTQTLRLFASSKRIDQTLTTRSLSRPLHATQDQLRSLGTSMLSLCQGSWATTLSLVYQTSNVCFGNVVSGRSVDIEAIDRLAAPTFNTIPIREDLARSRHGHDLLKSLQRLNTDTLPYQFTPLRLAQKLAGFPGRNLFETLLILQKPLHEMDDSVWILEEDSGGMDVPVVCEVVPCPSLDNIVVNLHYDTNTVDSSTANALIDIFDFVKERILQSPYAVLPTRSDIPMHLKEVIQTLRPRKERLETVRTASNSQDSWSSTQVDIRQAFSDLSGVASKRISQTTTIFQLGLDSINAVQIAALLRRHGYDVSASDVIASPTCAKLEAVLLDSDRNPARKATAYRLSDFSDAVMAQVQATLPSQDVPEAVLPCTPIQCAMLQSWINSDGHNYFNTITFEVNQSIDLNTLEQAWKQLSRLHPMLRTGFLQVDHPDATFAMVRHAPSASAVPIARVNNTEVHQYLTSLHRACLRRPFVPPWGVVLSESGETTTMTLAIHHALYDAESLSQLLEALTRLSSGRNHVSIGAVEPGLSSLLSQSLGNKKSAEKFWKAQAGRAVVNKFPVMTPLKEPPGPMVSASIISSMSSFTLQQAAQEANLSVQAIIQASWTRILSSYLGENSVVFGVSLSGRVDNATRNAPFPCLVTVPVVASNVESNQTLLRTMMDFNTNAHANQFAPLSQVQKWLGHPVSPVFDTLVSFRRNHTKSTSQLFRVVKDDPVIDYPVSLEVETGLNHELRISTTFKPEVLSEGQANTMLQQFEAVMTHLALHPDGSESGLSNNALQLFSQVPPEIADMKPPVQFLHQFVEQRAATHPDKLALEFVGSLSSEPRRWTYRELDQLGNRVANMLAEVAPIKSIVAVHFDKCPEAYFSILGILKAGCSFVALDTTAPAARKAFILEDSQTPCVLTNLEHDLHFDSASGTKIIRVSEDSLRRYSTMPRNMADHFNPQSTCYCLYTSGTTGTPKGCEITHDNAVHAMMAFQNLFSGHWEYGSRWLQFAALHFDVSVLEQYWSWSVGIAVVAAPKEVILDDLTGSINQLGITHIDLTPSLARLTHPDEVPSLCRGVFITGGESLKQEILDVWGPKAVIYNAYGPTEATIGVTMYQRVPVNGRPSNIGKQFPNVGSYVFKPGTETPVLRGGVGELCVSGKLVGKGYLNRPELTDENFPTLTGNGDRIYRTGDLVRVLHDGCFDFLGRADDQVKLRGQRLEIGEINHVIRGVPGIHDAATIVATQKYGDKAMLVAFLVADDTTKSQELRPLEDGQGLGALAKEACRGQLPAYMVPTHCIQLPFIPLSVNNKADAKQLRGLFAELSHDHLMRLTTHASQSSLKASGEMLVSVIVVLASFSNMQATKISGESSTFDLGVDSISAIRLSTMLKSSGWPGATPAVVLRNPIVSELALVLSKTKSPSHESKIQEGKQRIIAYGHRYRSLACRELDLSSEEIEYIAPCSSLQEAMLSKAMSREDTDAYFNSFDLLLNPAVDLSELRGAWEALVADEPILRTQFVSTPSGFIQVATKSAGIPWQHVKAGSGTPQHDALSSDRQRWLDDNRDQIRRPLAFTIVQGGKNAILRVNIFHAIYDGTSFELMLSRVEKALRREKISRGPSLLEAFVHGPLWNHDPSKQFWETHLKGWSPSPMPTTCEKPCAEPHIAERSLSIKLIDKVRTKENVTLQSVLLALWTSVLQQYFPHSLTLGLVVSGRSIEVAGVENTIGPLFNTLPFFNQSLKGRTWSSLIRQCHDFSSTILSFQHVPLHKIQKWCTDGQRLFETLFALQVESADAELRHNLWQVLDGESSPEYPLAFEVTSSRDDSLVAKIVAQGHVAGQDNIEHMLNLVQDHLQLMSEDTNWLIPVEYILADQETQSTDAVVTEVLNQETTAFEWDEVSIIIREEAASLAGLEAEDVKPNTTMLQLGLDSIDFIKLSAKLKTRRVAIPASKIMQLRTIAKISEETSEAEASSTHMAANITRIQSNLQETLRVHGSDLSGVEEVLPATPLQESMVAAMLDSDFEWYFNHDVRRLRSDTDVDRLKMAWDQVIQALPILRTAFFSIEDTALESAYCQVVFKQPQVWHAAQDGAAEGIFDNVMENAQKRAMASAGRSDLFQLSFVEQKSQNYIVISIAHALYDGWSLSLLNRELGKAYNGLTPSTSSIVPFLSNTLGQGQAKSSTFWADYLHQCPSALVPQRDQSHGSVCKMEKKSEVQLSDIQPLCRQLSISSQALTQACWAVVLSQLTRQLDTVFGVVMSGRDFEGSEDLVFPTMNTVAFRCVLHGLVSGFLTYVEETMASVRQHQSYPLRKALAAAKAPAGGLFNSLFLLQKTITEAEEGDPLLESVKGASAVDYPICVEAEILDGSLTWHTACQTNFMTEDDTQGLLELLDETMQFLVHSPHSELLAFNATQVSICGLPSIQLRPTTGSSTSKYTEVDVTRDTTQESLAITKVLSQVSGVEEHVIQPSNNLYHLGLDSISAIKVASLLRREGLDLATRDIIRADNIGHLISMARNGNNRSSKEPDQDTAEWKLPASLSLEILPQRHNILPADVEATLPALPMQVYMLGTWQNSRRTVFYPNFSYTLHSKCGDDTIKAAWGRLVQSTPILRTRFISTGLSEMPLLQVILRETTENAMVRFKATWDEEQHAWRFSLKIHHALYDGVSLPAIMQNLTQAIKQRTRADSNTTSISQADTLAPWTRYTTNPTLPSSRSGRKDFWTRYLSGCPRHLPLSEPRTGYPIERVSYIERSAVHDTANLRRLAAKKGVSVQSLFLAAYAKVLSRRGSAAAAAAAAHHDALDPHGDVVFGIYYGNRSGEEVDGLSETFPRLSLVPLRVGVGGRSLVDVAFKIQTDLAAIAREGRADVGLWEVAEWTGIQITSFVNFLSLPAAADGEEEEEGVGLSLEVAQGAAATLPEPSDVDEVGDVAVRDAFPPAVDIEASLRGNSLDIGVFAPHNLVPDEVFAAGLVGEIVVSLQEDDG